MGGEAAERVALKVTDCHAAALYNSCNGRTSAGCNFEMHTAAHRVTWVRFLM